VAFECVFPYIQVKFVSVLARNNDIRTVGLITGIVNIPKSLLYFCPTYLMRHITYFLLNSTTPNTQPAQIKPAHHPSPTWA
jgi:hypothetical protein